MSFRDQHRGQHPSSSLPGYRPHTPHGFAYLIPEHFSDQPLISGSIVF